MVKWNVVSFIDPIKDDVRTQNSLICKFVAQQFQSLIIIGYKKYTYHDMKQSEMVLGCYQCSRITL